jgi:hypothetical protein
MTLPDSTIRQTLLSELKRQSWTHIYNLNVTVTNGVVDLWGYAQSDEERRAIRVAAEDIPGVICQQSPRGQPDICILMQSNCAPLSSNLSGRRRAEVRIALLSEFHA